MFFNQFVIDPLVVLPILLVLRHYHVVDFKFFEFPDEETEQ